MLIYEKIQEIKNIHDEIRQTHKNLENNLQNTAQNLSQQSEKKLRESLENALIDAKNALQNANAQDLKEKKESLSHEAAQNLNDKFVNHFGVLSESLKQRVEQKAQDFLEQNFNLILKDALENLREEILQNKDLRAHAQEVAAQSANEAIEQNLEQLLDVKLDYSKIKISYSKLGESVGENVLKNENLEEKIKEFISQKNKDSLEDKNLQDFFKQKAVLLYENELQKEKILRDKFLTFIQLAELKIGVQMELYARISKGLVGEAPEIKHNALMVI